MPNRIKPTAPLLPDATARPATPYTGEVVYVYAYDVAYEMRRAPVTELLGQRVALFGLDASRRNRRRERRRVARSREW